MLRGSESKNNQTHPHGEIGELVHQSIDNCQVLILQVELLQKELGDNKLSNKEAADRLDSILEQLENNGTLLRKLHDAVKSDQ